MRSQGLESIQIGKKNQSISEMFKVHAEPQNLPPLTRNFDFYVGTVNGPTSITQLGVLKMSQKIASFSF